MAYEVLGQLPVTGTKILRDELVVLSNPAVAKDYPGLLRRVVALVEIDGSEQEMIFLSNNLEWSPASIADLYRNRWSIEAFFKQIKQTLQLADFLGHSANAVRWQVWTALLVYVLLRFLAFLHGWAHSFTRLFTVMRTSIWRRWDLPDLLRRYGTADGSFRFMVNSCGAVNVAVPQEISEPCETRLLRSGAGKSKSRFRHPASSSPVNQQLHMPIPVPMGWVCIVVVPDDVHPRQEWLVAFAKMGVRLFPESALVQMLSGELPLASIATRSALRSRRSLRNEGAPSGRVQQSVRGGRANESAA